MTHFAKLLSVALLSLGLAAGAPALTIDDFEEGDFNVLDPNTAGATSAEQTGLSLTSVIGGTRLVEATAAGSGAVSASAVLTTGAGDDAALLTGIPTGNFAFVYDAIADGVGNGKFGALGLDLSNFASIDIELIAPANTPNLSITMWDSNAADASGSVAGVDGINSIALTEFGSLDLSDIRTIRVSLNALAGPASLASISATPVPEPTTGALLALGLVGLAARRRS